MDKEFAEIILKLKQEIESRKVRIAFFGQPGAGKSSLINKIIGRKVMRTGAETDVTKKAETIEHNSAIYVDLPGYGTDCFPATTYFQTFDPLQYDLFICVFSGKFQAADSEFFRALHTIGKRCIFVRNKLDTMHEPHKTLAELQVIVTNDLQKQVGQAVKVCFTSCNHKKYPLNNGIPELIDNIFSELLPAKQYSFILSAQAHTLKHLEQKKTACEENLIYYAGLAAANGINPIPFADIALDFGIVNKMYAKIRSIFNIDQATLTNYNIPRNLSASLLKSFSKEGIIILLKKYSGRIANKSFSKYIPFIGPIIAGGTGFAMVKYAGSEYIEECYAIGKIVLEEELSKHEIKLNL